MSRCARFSVTRGFKTSFLAANVCLDPMQAAMGSPVSQLKYTSRWFYRRMFPRSQVNWTNSTNNLQDLLRYGRLVRETADKSRNCVARFLRIFCFQSSHLCWMQPSCWWEMFEVVAVNSNNDNKKHHWCTSLNLFNSFEIWKEKGTARMTEQFADNSDWDRFSDKITWNCNHQVVGLYPGKRISNWSILEELIKTLSRISTIKVEPVSGFAFWCFYKKVWMHSTV